MNKKLLALLCAVMVVVVAFAALVACDDTPDTPPTPPTPPTPAQTTVSVAATTDSVFIKDEDIASYNYSSLFVVKQNNVTVLIQPSYLDLSQLPTQVGQTGKVTCTFKGEQASVSVTMTTTNYQVTLDVEQVEITNIQVSDYDFLAHFTATVDGQTVAITPDMVTSTVSKTPGNYAYTVTNGSASQTLAVTVTQGHYVEVLANYAEYQLLATEVDEFDYTTLFAVYEDGSAVPVTEQMLDLSALQGGVSVGNTYNVTLTFESGGLVSTATVPVTIVEPQQIVITAQNVNTYPNSQPIDLTTLFSITQGNTVIDVTADMITGSVDYTAVGDNVITLTYQGNVKQATVTVRQGVVINTPNGKNIVMRAGVDKATYNFAQDFHVIVNGIRMQHIDSYINADDVAAVDFSTAGTYAVSISVPYYDGAATIRPTFTNTTQTVTYTVVKRTVNVSVKNQTLLFDEGTTPAIMDNVSVILNNIAVKVVADRAVAEASPLAVWGEITSPSLDTTSIAPQLVVVNVYANGLDNDPIEVSFYVQMKSAVKVTATSKIVFSGATVYTRDLFAIKSGEKDVAVEQSMISGHINSFVPGIYVVSVNYLGVTATATVAVMDGDLVGTYSTYIRRLAEDDETSSGDLGDVDSGGGWGDDDDIWDDWYGGGEYSVGNNTPIVRKNPQKAADGEWVGGMSIGEDGIVTVDGKQATIVSAVDSRTVVIAIGTNHYTLHYNNGIVVLDPDNSIKMSFNDYKRPLVYFQDSHWKITRIVTINSNSGYILTSSSSSSSGYSYGYSINTFFVESKTDANVKMWYALKTHLVEKHSSDYVYNVTWGEATYADGFNPAANAKSTLTLNGEEYDFTMTSNSIGKVDAKEDTTTNKYVGMSFVGSVNGKAAEIVVRNNVFALSYDTTNVQFSTSEIDKMTNGGILEETDMLFFYKYTEGKLYSYKFQLDVANKTFTLLPRDDLFGLYKQADGAYVFLDGYGTGHADLEENYYVARLTYTSQGNQIVAKFVNTPSTFTVAPTMVLIRDVFGNVLTTTTTVGEQKVDMSFVNSNITSGGVVQIGQTTFMRGTSKADIIKTITITTADGVWTEAQKGNGSKGSAIDLSSVSTSAAGIYNFSVTLNVFGTTVTNRYALQIVGIKYGDSSEQNAVLGSYKSVTGAGTTLTLDKFGMLTVAMGSAVYVGEADVTMDGENMSFVAHVLNGNSVATVTGHTVQNGVLLVRSTGGVVLHDYFVNGTSNVAGTEDVVLYRINPTNGNPMYLFGKNLGVTGTPVELTLVEGSDIGTVGAVVSVPTANGSKIVRINSWNDGTNGLTVSDVFRGTYSCSEAGNLVIDGFGNATLGANHGEYKRNSNGSLSVTWADGAFAVYEVNVTQKTYVVSDLKLDNSLVANKVFNFVRTFACPNASDSYATFEVTTTITFKMDGTVQVVSTSAEHDDSSDGCTCGSFVATLGASGTYAVSGNKVTVTVGSHTFAFQITDVTVAKTLVTTSTTLTSNDMDYFAVDSVFEA